MSLLDWIVLVGTVIAIAVYGLYRGRGSDTMERYLLAGKTMPWYAMGLSIMATQASAITFISTTGQAYVDGMRFVQFYFGLPIAMVIISATVVPLFHRAGVYTAYEYLERRFDSKTRALASIIFLLQRGLAAGLVIYAPSVVLALILGWPERVTVILVGAVVVVYTSLGGIKAVTWTDVQQMVIIFIGLIVSLITVLVLLPSEISLGDAAFLAGAAGRLNAVTTNFNWQDQFNIWSGLLGSTFLFLSYFGCDQSQVQRYLTGRSIAQSRLSLLFNAVAKVPMQAFILFIGAMVFVFYLFVEPPILFQQAELARIQAKQEYAPLEIEYRQAFERRRSAALSLAEAHRKADAAESRIIGEYRSAQKELDAVRGRAANLVESADGKKGFDDTNYIFLSFVTRYLPPGIVGLVIAAIFAAAMSSVSGEINSLATVTVIDLYKRFFRRSAPDRHYLAASRWATVFWGAYAVVFAVFAGRLGSLIVAVNAVGSLFYGSLLGCFALALGFPRVRGTATFTGMIVGEAAVLATASLGSVSWLWYNAIGCLVVVFTGLAITYAAPAATPQPK